MIDWKAHLPRWMIILFLGFLCGSDSYSGVYSATFSGQPSTLPEIEGLTWDEGSKELAIEFVKKPTVNEPSQDPAKTEDLAVRIQGNYSKTDYNLVFNNTPVIRSP